MGRRIHHVTQHRSGLVGVEAMRLFSEHSFPRHTHDQYGIGIMTAGAQKSWSVIGHVESRSKPPDARIREAFRHHTRPLSQSRNFVQDSGDALPHNQAL